MDFLIYCDDFYSLLNMINFRDYFKRKFYSKTGRASQALCKPQFSPAQLKEKPEITMEFIESELHKARSELGRRRKILKPIRNTSSFLVTTRENYMKPFVIVT